MEIEPGLEKKVHALAARVPTTCSSHLGIVHLSFARDCLRATMPVDQRTRQPFGLLHGGASVVLAETLASSGAWLNVDESRFDVVGIEINANHLRAVEHGVVMGTATPIHRGSRIQVWEVRITDESQRVVCVSRCTLAVVERREEKLTPS